MILLQDASTSTGSGVCAGGAQGGGLLQAAGCAAVESWPWVLAVLLVLIGSAVWFWRQRAAQARSVPLLVFPTSGGPAAVAAPGPGGPGGPGRPGAVGAAAAAAAGSLESASAPSSVPSALSSNGPATPARAKGRKRRKQKSLETDQAGEAPTSPGAPPSHALPTPLGAPGLARGSAPAVAHASPSAVEPELPGAVPDGTLQLLPGSLTLESGPGAPEQIRFVRIPGAPPEVTFGRLPGPDFRHVQLRSPAVSRLHARMVYGEAGWTIRNESGTNPTVVNGTPLDSASGDVALNDGDQIEMGDISLRFQSGVSRQGLATRSGWHTDRGPRPENQDTVLVRRLGDGRELAALCDGMGSHQAGGRASHAAMEALVQALEEGGSLEESVAAAQRAVLDVAAEEDRPEGIGTTLVAALRDGDAYRLVNVGDSRGYRFAGGQLTQLTRDHSFVEEAVSSGSMTEAEARRSPLRNAVTRSLGEDPASEAEYFGPFPVTKGELLLLSSDGLHGVMDLDAIASILQTGLPAPDLPRRLVRAALEAGTRDNVSVAVLGFGSGSS